MGRPLVLDTSALLAGRPLGPGEDTLIPQAVQDELKPGGRDHRHLQNLLAAGAKGTDATASARARVREEAARGGDLARLSRADVDVLAVALDTGGELLTDDYTVQNVARRMGIPTRSIQTRGITEGYTFVTRCTGCRKLLDAPADECPVCGSPTRTVKDRTPGSGSKTPSSKPR